MPGVAYRISRINICKRFPQGEAALPSRSSRDRFPSPSQTGPSANSCHFDSKIALQGQGKNAKDVVTHVCRTYGSEDAFCCVLKGEKGTTKSMDETKK